MHLLMLTWQRMLQVCAHFHSHYYYHHYFYVQSHEQWEHTVCHYQQCIKEETLFYPIFICCFRIEMF